MNSNIRIAREMLRIANELVAGDFSDKSTYESITKTKVPMNQFKQLKQVFQPKPLKQAEEDDSLSDASMDAVAEELLKVAQELLKDGE